MTRAVGAPGGFRASPQQRWRWRRGADGDRPARVAARIALEGDLQPDLLAAALALLVERHEILRTTFHGIPGSGQVVQVVEPPYAPAVAMHDLSGRGEGEQTGAVAALVARAIRLPVAGQPPLGAELVRLSAASHRLLVTLPALAMDGPGLAVLTDALSAAYAAATRGLEAAAGADPLQYADVAAWLNEVLEDDEGEAGREFWRRPEARAPWRPPALPLARRAPPGAPPVWARLGRAVGAVRGAAVDALAGRLRVSPPALLLAAFAALLGRLTGESEVVLPVGFDGRRHPELAGALGPLSRDIPVRCRVEPGRPFAAVAAAVEQTLREVAEWQESYDPEGGATPREAIAFECWDDGNVTRAEGVRFTLLERVVPLVEGALRLGCARRHDDVTVLVDYDAAAHDAGDAGRLAGQLEALLRHACARPEDPVGLLDVLSADERRRLVTAPDRPAAGWPRETCMHTAIEAQVRRTPEAVALAGEGAAVTYAELDRRANRLAHRLRRLGVRSNVPVALCLPRSPALVTAILGVLKAGAAYVPLDPGHPLEHRRALLEDSGARVAVTDARLAAEIAAPGLATIGLDAEAAEVAKEPSDPPPAPVRAADLAYVIYTSGSTGRPKGVMVTHRSLMCSTTARLAHYRDPVERFLLLSPAAFDSSVAGIFWTLVSGGTLVLVPEALQHDPVRLAERLAAERVTHLLTLPSYWGLLLQAAGGDRLGTLRTVIVAGEPCPKAVVDRHRALVGAAALFSEYGPTESTVWCSVADCRALERPTVPLGRPIAGAALYVLDANLQPVPTGVAGEVHVGGEVLALGYHNRPALTAERFLPSPFDVRPGARLYRTGDRARYLPDGDLEFLGRVDNQVKIRGFRVEPEEIEGVLGLHPAVREAAVVPHPTTAPGGEPAGPGAVTAAPLDLAARLAALDGAAAERLVREVEGLPDAGGPGEPPTAPPPPAPLRLARATEDFEITLEIGHADFIAPPRATQRRWLVSRAIGEFAQDLRRLDQVARRFVPGAEFRYEEHARSPVVTDEELLEAGQEPVMRAMAGIVARERGHVLEVGFGHGVSASAIQAAGVTRHTIIEADPAVIERYYRPWRARYADRDVRLVPGRWEDADDEVESDHDGILCHTYPLSEEEFVDRVLGSVTYAEHFYAFAARHLRKGGVFTYVTYEIDSLSREHQRRLLEYFESVELRVQPLRIAPDTRDLWWADSMVVVRATK